MRPCHTWYTNRVMAAALAIWPFGSAVAAGQTAADFHKRGIDAFAMPSSTAPSLTSPRRYASTPIWLRPTSGVHTRWAEAVFDKAIDDLNEAVRIKPTDADAYAFRGQRLRAKGEFDKAFADFDKAIRLDPNCVLAYEVRVRLVSQA